VESFVQWLQGLNPLLIYLAVFGIAFVENIFPPSPSDIMIVAAGSLIGIRDVGFTTTLLSATAGSVLGWMVMYKLGDWFGVKIIETGRLKFIPVDALKKVELWFSRYGYWIVVVNRFLTGTRAVVSFFAGMSKLDLVRTTILCSVSALVWNAILVGAGYYLGRNWQQIEFYLHAYSQVVTAAIVVGLLLLAVHFIQKMRRPPAHRRKTHHDSRKSHQ
jgi:membrane protein DedA with SNARE-associated domain